jgi:gamma-glutamylcyclotransferase (GGCT)/AIG2-like uncharacterized protein YtfP
MSHPFAVLDALSNQLNGDRDRLLDQLHHQFSWIDDFLGQGQLQQQLSTEPSLSALLETLKHLLTSTYAEIFVYGTLLPGESNRHYMNNAHLVADDALENAQLYNCGPYPMLLPGRGTVYGQVYRVPLMDIPALDALEDHPNYYYRQIVTLQSDREAWVYFGREQYVTACALIVSGRWRDRE